jgi:hypothetical protein
MMDGGLFSAGAALVGAAIGGSMSFLGSWIVQQKEVHAQWVGQDRLRRQELYKEFIQQASKCYADALQHQTPDVPALVVLYGKISRIRAISSPKVLGAAEQVLRRIADIYFEPPIVLTRDQIRSMLRDGSVDILRDFSQTCRAEFEMLRSQQLSSGMKALRRVG